MHISGVARIRVIIILVLMLVIWQIMKYWNELARQKELLIKSFDSPVVVTVYYEALCPDSKYFVIKQLQETNRKAPYLMKIELVPYGKASTSTNPDGSLRFSCQHGRVECEANIIHACAIEIINDTTLRLNMISCMIKDNNDPLAALKRCAHDETEFDQIKKCSSDPHGAELLKMYGESTEALRPKMTFVPTVTLDGKQNNQAHILKDLLSEICKEISDKGSPPSICDK